MRVPQPATVISCVALFVALGGTGYAVTALPDDSVGSRQLRASAVKEAELGNRAVVTRKLADQAVTNPKLARGAVTADRVAADALGAAQIDESSLGRVPSAATAGHATTADRAALADRVDLAARATQAERAELADRATVASGLRGVVRKSVEYTIPSGGGDVVEVGCDAGTLPSGGGWVSAADSDIPIVISSGPLGERRWFVELIDLDFSAAPLHGTAYAICVPVDGA
jgi:hypothetical protein